MIELTENPIDLNTLLSGVGDASCGAQVLFVGTTRQWTHRLNADSSNGERIETEYLIYDAYREMAISEMQQLEDAARARWPVRDVVLVHRLGRVAPKEASVAVAVSCPHRSEAFEAARWLIDELKHQVPIWKQEHYVQNGSEWIHPTDGSCRCGDSAQETVSDRAGKSSMANVQEPQ